MTDASPDSPLARLKSLGLELPAAAAPVANYVAFSRAGNLLFVSGQLPVSNGVIAPDHKGKLGAGVSLVAGQAAARLAALNVLAQAQRRGRRSRQACGRCGSAAMSIAPRISMQLPQVVNGASDLVAMVLEPNGGHARFAVGVAQLPLDAAVEVEGIFEILE